jgi:hypothetical protein
LGREVASEERTCGEGSGEEGVRRHRRKRRERSGEGSSGRRRGSVRRVKASEGDGKAWESACGSALEDVGGEVRTSSSAASLGWSW